MLHSNQEAEVTTGSGGRRNPFGDLIASIFRKKSKEREEDLTDGSDNDCEVTRTFDTRTISSSSEYKIYPLSREVSDNTGFSGNGELSIENKQKSPISSRSRSFHEDMEALRLSRQDNPYIQQKLERFSLHGDSMSSNFTTTGSNSTKQDQQRLIESDLVDSNSDHDNNLHEHLIRSPPPQFPQHISHFVFPTRTISPQNRESMPGSSSPDSNLNHLPGPINKELGTLIKPKAVNQSVFPLSDPSHKRERKSKDLNPLLTKSGMGALDPRVKEVLEFQRQSLFPEPRKEVVSPIDKAPISTDPLGPQRSLSLAGKSNSRWTMTTASRSVSLPTVQPLVSNISSSVLSLNGNTSDLESNKATNLAPVKSGRSAAGIENLAFRC